VTHSSVYFLAGSIMLVFALSAVTLHYFSRAHRATGSSWEDLVRRLQPIDPAKVAEIALDLIEEPVPSNGELSRSGFDTTRIREMIGGLDGLEVLKNNSETLIDMAAHLQHWYPEAIKVAEELRLDTRELEWHINRLREAAKNGNLEVSFPFYAQHAVAIYYRMCRELLSFCEQADPSMFAALKRAI